MTVIKLDDSNFNNTIKSGKVIVDFYADWCGPCRMMGPVFEELSNEFKDIKFGKINIDEHDPIAEEHDISTIPCLVFFKDGVEVSRTVGFFPKSQLLAKIVEAFK